MKLKIFLFIIAIGLFQIQAQNNLVIKLKVGTEQNAVLNYLQKLTFPDENMLLTYNNGNTESYLISNIRNITFNSVTIVNNELVEKDQSSFIYPNPATDFVYVKNINREKCEITIFQIDGRIVMQTQILSEDEAINISALSQGFYLFKFNGQVFKFRKI